MVKIPDTEIVQNNDIPAQLRGETVAYAVQSGVYNLGANFFEPYLNYRVQKYYAARPGAHGNYTQNLAGEFAGDIVGASTLILAEALIPDQLHTFIRAARGHIDPLYTSVAHAVFARECTQPDYEQKMEKWKTFQERSLVRSSIIAAAGIAGNVATQKLLIGNPSPAGLIFKGKLLSTALTTILGLGVRFAFPKQTHGMDKWMGKNLFAPLMEDRELEPPADEVHSVSSIDGLSARKGERTYLPGR